MIQLLYWFYYNLPVVKEINNTFYEGNEYELSISNDSGLFLSFETTLILDFPAA